MTLRYFTGVGSRETPADILSIMQQYSKIMADKDWVLRSGGAIGADTAFYEGWLMSNSLHKKTPSIFVPDLKFNRNARDGKHRIVVTNQLILNKADELIREIHPAYQYLTPYALGLHIRNCFQVLGAELDQPSKGLLCYAKTDSKGEPKGGTRTAIKLAERYNIPVRNLYKQQDLYFISDFIERNR